MKHRKKIKDRLKNIPRHCSMFGEIKSLSFVSPDNSVLETMLKDIKISKPSHLSIKEIGRPRVDRIQIDFCSNFDKPVVKFMGDWIDYIGSVKLETV